MKSKIAVITAFDNNHADLLEITRPIYNLYCDNQNYDFIEYKIENFDRPQSWFKVVAIQKTLELGYEHILWCDADSIILKQDYDLNNFIDGYKSLYICRDNMGLNAGIFIVKNTDLIKSFFRTVETMYPRYLNNHPWCGVWEQAAIWELFGSNYLDIVSHTQLVPQYILNAYKEHVNDQTFILHLPNTPHEQRKNLLLQYRMKYYENNIK
jgi:hypothetical protein